MKHAAATIWAGRDQREPKHDKGWTASSIFADQWPSLAELWPEACTPCPQTPGKHAKPFGKHHPATPILSAQSATEKIAPELSHAVIVT